jgi:hypothetical protein
LLLHTFASTWILAIIIDVQWHLIVLIYSFLMIYNVEHFISLLLFVYPPW